MELSIHVEIDYPQLRVRRDTIFIKGEGNKKESKPYNPFVQCIRF